MMMTKLSRAQKRLLCDIAKLPLTGRASKMIPGHDPEWRYWEPSYDFEWMHPASISRTLRRLERRGLVERDNDRTTRGSQRTTTVRLTDAGTELVKRLTSETTGEMLTVSED